MAEVLETAECCFLGLVYFSLAVTELSQVRVYFEHKSRHFGHYCTWLGRRGTAKQPNRYGSQNCIGLNNLSCRRIRPRFNC